MLMLLFRVGAEPWAIAAFEVREVVPLVAIQAIDGRCLGRTSDNLSGSSAGLMGLMTYRSETIPVVDVMMLLSGQPAEQTLDTRIVIVNCDRSTGSSSSDSADRWPRKCVGLIVKQANETARLAPVDVLVSRCYVESTWQAQGCSKVVYKLATERLVAQVYADKKSVGLMIEATPERTQWNGIESPSFQTMTGQAATDPGFSLAGA